MRPGGLGLAPLRSLINQVLDERGNSGKVTILYGAQASVGAALQGRSWPSGAARADVEVHVTVDRPDEEWKGNVGVITTLFPKVARLRPQHRGRECAARR